MELGSGSFVQSKPRSGIPPPQNMPPCEVTAAVTADGPQQDSTWTFNCICIQSVILQWGTPVWGMPVW